MKYKELKRRIKLGFSVVCATLLCTGWGLVCLAEPETSLMETIGTSDTIELYISNLDEYSEATGQIGREAIEVLSFEQNIPGRTVFMIDNSLSVTKANLEKSKEIINQYLEKKNSDEMVSVAIFGEHVEEYLVTDEKDSAVISEKLATVANVDKETFLTDALYEELPNYEDKSVYTRFVVISDGVDNKAIGYTKEELTDYLKSNTVPIFSIGCKNKNNEEMLKNMFAISRLTNAGYFLLDDYSQDTYSEIVDSLLEPVSCVVVSIPDSLRDGSTQNILLTFETAEGTVEVKDEMTMPFGDIRKEEPTPEAVEVVEEPEPEPEVIEEPEPSVEPAPVIEEEPPKEGGLDATQKIAIVVIILALVGYVVYMIMKKKGKGGKKEEKPVQTSAPAAAPVPAPAPAPMPTSVPSNDGRKTVVLSNLNKNNVILVVTDANDPSKVFRYPLRGRVIIGRKKDNEECKDVNIVINYNKWVSGRHLAVSMQQNQLYIEDLNSANGTFVNGSRINGVCAVAPGTRVTIGQLEIILSIEG